MAQDTKEATQFNSIQPTIPSATRSTTFAPILPKIKQPDSSPASLEQTGETKTPAPVEANPTTEQRLPVRITVFSDNTLKELTFTKEYLVAVEEVLSCLGENALSYQEKILKYCEMSHIIKIISEEHGKIKTLVSWFDLRRILIKLFETNSETGLKIVVKVNAETCQRWKFFKNILPPTTEAEFLLVEQIDLDKRTVKTRSDERHVGEINFPADEALPIAVYLSTDPRIGYCSFAHALVNYAFPGTDTKAKNTRRNIISLLKKLIKPKSGLIPWSYFAPMAKADWEELGKTLKQRKCAEKTITNYKNFLRKICNLYPHALPENKSEQFFPTKTPQPIQSLSNQAIKIAKARTQKRHLTSSSSATAQSSSASADHTWTSTKRARVSPLPENPGPTQKPKHPIESGNTLAQTSETNSATLDDAPAANSSTYAALVPQMTARYPLPQTTPRDALLVPNPDNQNIASSNLPLPQPAINITPLDWSLIFAQALSFNFLLAQGGRLQPLAGAAPSPAANVDPRVNVAEGKNEGTEAAEQAPFKKR